MTDTRVSSVAGPGVDAAPVSESLARLSWRGASSSVAHYLVVALAGFLISPILLASLGPGLFGTWKMCQRLLTGVSAVDGRAAQALRWTIANRRSDGDLDALRRSVGAAVVVWLRFLPVVALTGAVLVWVAPFVIRGLPPEHIPLTRVTVGILLVNLIVLPLSGIPESALVGVNLAHRPTWVRAAGAAVGGLALVAAVGLGLGIVGLAASVLLTNIMMGLVILADARRVLPWFGMGRPRQDEVRQFFGFSAWLLLASLAHMLSSDIIVLGMVASTSTVTSFVLSTYAMQLAVELIIRVASSNLPALGDIVGRGDVARAARLRREIMLLCWLATVVAGCLILLWNAPFLTLWVGGENFIGHPANRLVVVLMCQLVFIRNDARLVDVTLNVRAKVLLGLLSNGLSMGLAYWLAGRMGSPVIGLAIGLMLGRSLQSFAYPVMITRVFGPVPRDASSLVRPFAVGWLMLAFSAWAGPRMPMVGWLGLAGAGAGSGLLATGVCVLGLTTEQRRHLTRRARQIFGASTSRRERS